MNEEVSLLVLRRRVALIALIIAALGQGVSWYLMYSYLHLPIFPQVGLTQLLFCVIITTSISFWCWYDSKIVGVELPVINYVIMALCGFFTVSRYFYARGGLIGWLKSIFGLWQLALAYVLSTAGSYLAYGVVYAIHTKGA